MEKENLAEKGFSNYLICPSCGYIVVVDGNASYHDVNEFWKNSKNNM